MKKSIIGAIVLLLMLVLVTATPVFAKSAYEIPDDAMQYNGHFYYYYEGSLTWDEAEAECEKLGGHLVTFSDKYEEDIVWRYIEDKGSPAWIGVYNAGFYDKIYQTIENDWKTVTGEKLKYKNWESSQPDNESHLSQKTYDKYVAIGRRSEISAENMEEDDAAKPSWGDFDNVYFVQNGTIKGYICEWDIYEIKVEETSIELKKGKKAIITYRVNDKAGHTQVKDAVVTFKSSKKKVAKVTKNGTIKAVGTGKCTIALKYKNAVVKIKVTVKKK